MSTAPSLPGERQTRSTFLFGGEMPELDERQSYLRQIMLDEQAKAVKHVRTQIASALAPLVKQAKTRIALKTDEDGRFKKSYDQHLQDKHPLHGLSFCVRSSDTLDWIGDKKLEAWVRRVIQDNIQEVTMFGQDLGLQWLHVSRHKRWEWESWRKFGFVQVLQISGTFDYRWYESAPR